MQHDAGVYNNSASCSTNATNTNTAAATATTTTKCAPPESNLNRKRKKILSAAEYNRICEFIHYYNGLAIDCELEMEHRQFTDIDRMTLKCVLQAELAAKMRSAHWRYEAKAKKLIKVFEAKESSTVPNDYLLKTATAEGLSPVMLSRALVQEKFHVQSKAQLARLMKYPHLIKDHQMSANVIQCLCSDNQDGPLVDLRRRLVGEEYEVKLKTLAKAAGMHYYDEHDLRRMGYDKTPDIKMILPFLYKGQVVNWIESKANFGDIRNHKFNVQQQLSSYSNRFGPGIVIYWFGYHEETPHLPENNVGIVVLDDFPACDDLVFMDLKNNDSSGNNEKPECSAVKETTTSNTAAETTSDKGSS